MDGSRVRRHEAGNQPQRRGLAAAARPQQRHELAVGDVERQVGDRGEARVAAVALRQAAYADPRHQADAPARTAPSAEGRTTALPEASQCATSSAMLMIATLTMASAATGSV